MRSVSSAGKPREGCPPYAAARSADFPPSCEHSSIASGSSSAGTIWPDLDTRVVVALSGGSDSVALAHLAARARRGRRAAVAGLAHFNHQLREHADRRRTVFCVDWPRRSAGRFSSNARTSRARAAASGARSRTRRAPRATSFSSARARTSAPTASRSAIRATIRPKPFCCAAARRRARKGWRRCIRARGRIVRPLLACRRADLRVFSPNAAVHTSTTKQTRREHSAQPRARRAAAAARGAVQSGDRRRAGR